MAKTISYNRLWKLLICRLLACRENWHAGTEGVSSQPQQGVHYKIRCRHRVS